MAVSFDLHKRLGSGYFGEVWHATDTGLNVECAVKIIPASKVPDPKNFFREAQILQAAEHQNVVRIRETGMLDGGRIYISMELLSKGSVEDEAKGGYVHLSRAKRIMVDVLRGLEHAHSQGILHRDIKPGNILVGENNEGKLADFGLAIPEGLDLKKLGVNDYVYPRHRAPELARSKPHSILSDIYACGVTLYRLINGDEGIMAVPLADVRGRAEAGTFPDRQGYRTYVTRPLKLVVNRAMHPNPALRYQTAEEMRRALEGCLIEANWDVKVLANGKRWSCGRPGRCIEVVLEQDGDGSWSVTTRHGPSKHKLQRITKKCDSGLKRKKAESFAGRVLQDYVLGRA